MTHDSDAKFATPRYGWRHRHVAGRRTRPAQDPPVGHRRPGEGTAVWEPSQAALEFSGLRQDGHRGGGGTKQDRYRGLIAKLLVDGQDANLEMVASGYSWHYKKYQSEQAPEERVAYAKAEHDARLARRGLLADASPVAPWDYRHGTRSRVLRLARAGRPGHLHLNQDDFPPIHFHAVGIRGLGLVPCPDQEPGASCPVGGEPCAPTSRERQRAHHGDDVGDPRRRHAIVA